MEPKFYLVGGAVRDLLMGLPVKDYDYAVECDSYEDMKAAITDRGGRIFVETPEYLTIRAIDVEGDITGLPKMATDFVMCRKDGEYVDGRRPEDVTPGTLYDDLVRRDFTVNAMAIDTLDLSCGGNDLSVDLEKIIDPFGGKADVSSTYLRTVGNALIRFDEDTLRMLRAIRFAVTKGFILSSEIIDTFSDDYFVVKMGQPKLTDRKRQELERCFAHDTGLTMWYIMHYCSPEMVQAIFCDGLWLKPTTEKRNIA
jgi:tRNA nucleotidyltransferase (CCA-adding enzyme)